MDTTRPLGESFLAPLHRHFINLMCVDSGDEAKRQYNGQPALYNFSAFVVDVDNRWFVITAGHIFRELKDAIAGGAKLSHWQIDDSIVSSNPQQPYLIPLDVDKDVLWFHNDTHGMDYAGFEIGHLARMALTKEGVSAIPESIWNADNLQEFSLWLLVGTPYKLSKLVLGEKLNKLHATVQLVPISPDEYTCEKTPYQRIYARINFESVADGEDGFDIEGMSGGPVFALRPTIDSCEYDYRIVGIQSAWDRKGNTALCAAPPFIQAIAQLIRKPSPSQVEAISNE